MKRKITVQFTILTFVIAYVVSGTSILLAKYTGYHVNNWVHTLPELSLIFHKKK